MCTWTSLWTRSCEKRDKGRTDPLSFCVLFSSVRRISLVESYTMYHVPILMLFLLLPPPSIYYRRDFFQIYYPGAEGMGKDDVIMDIHGWMNRHLEKGSENGMHEDLLELIHEAQVNDLLKHPLYLRQRQTASTEQVTLCTYLHTERYSGYCVKISSKKTLWTDTCDLIPFVPSFLAHRSAIV